MDFQSPEWQRFSIEFCYWGGYFFALLGAVKLVIFLLGELCPGVYSRVKSERWRNFLTGTWNRLIFGLLGLFTVGLGLFIMMATKLLEILMERTQAL